MTCQTNEAAGKYYNIRIDEATDTSNTEQMVFCLHYVDDKTKAY